MGGSRRPLGSDLVELLACLVAGLLLMSCPNPLTGILLLQAKDKTGPVITITCPSDGSNCAKTVVVAGKVVDSSSVEQPGRVASLRYEILATSLADAVPVSADGTFSFQFSTVGLGSPFVLTLTATDWNSNTSQKSISLLLRAGSDIPSFTVTPGNHSVSFQWDPVSLAESYTIHYTTNGAVPSADYGTHVAGVNSPCSISGLENGKPCVFVLQARSSDGPDNWSAAIKAIPVSPLTLCPTVTGGSGQISLEWAPIAGTATYDVLRSTDRRGEYGMIVGGLQAITYVDEAVQPYQTYYYKVRPTGDPSVASAPSWGCANAFAKTWPAMIGTLFGLWATDFGSVTVDGTYAYVTITTNFLGVNNNLDVVDISDPRHPSAVGFASLNQGGTNAGKDLIIHSHVAYVAGPAQDLLTAIDMTDPINPGPPSQKSGFTDLHDLCGKDATHIIAADGLGGVKTLDVTSPLVPSVERTYTTTGTACGVCFDAGRNLILVADGASGLAVIDAASGAPAYCDTQGSALSVALNAGFAYVADDTGGLSIVNTANPSAPSLTATLSLPGKACDVSLDGSRAFVACGTGGLAIVDVSNPSTPYFTGIDDSPADASSVFAGSGKAYVADHGDTTAGLKVFDVSGGRPSPGSVQIISEGAGPLASDGSHLYYAGGPSGLGMDIADMGSETVAGQFSTFENRQPFYILTRGDLVIVSYLDLTTTSYVEILDASDPLLPRRISLTSFPGAAATGYVFGDIMYVSSQAGLQLYDISDPAAPTLVSRVNVPGTAYFVEVHGTLAYIMTLSGSFAILDVAKPAAPVLRGSCAIPGGIHFPCKVGDYVYVGGTLDGADCMYAIDVSNPDSPSLPGSCPTLGIPYDKSASLPYLLVGSSWKTELLDVSKPLQPVTVAVFDPSCSDATGVVACGNRVFVNAQGLHSIRLDSQP